jgi:hypothetical protein
LGADFLTGGEAITHLGDGQPGGKAQGLVFFNDMLRAEYDPGRFPAIDVGVPRFTIITTEMFDRFVDDNDLHAIATSGRSDAEIARAFLERALPEPVEAYLRELVRDVTFPIAVRSSSILEDAIFCPFAGVYWTKMVPTNQPEPAERQRKLAEAIKLVWASTFCATAVRYRRAGGKSTADEKMGVILQEVVGTRFGERFYPHLSGVGRSHDFYPAPDSDPRDGVVNLALGLGKTIVDGGISWSYSPARPQAPPPYGSTAEQLRASQLRFWALNLAAHDDDPLAESEHLVHPDLPEAESDEALSLIASTYDAGRDRIVPGIGAPGPRVITFAPILSLGLLPVNEVVRELLAICERAAGSDVEIEFAMSLPGPGRDRARLGFLQVRPMSVSDEKVTIGDGEISGPDVLVAPGHVMGNGTVHGIRDVVYVEPESFHAKHTRAIASEIEKLNAELTREDRSYVLIGFGRWGSSDPWLGIPVDWSQISGARVIVEATLPEMNVDPSQGSHFFHNLSSFRISYLSVRHDANPPGINWDGLKAFPVVRRTGFLRHVRSESPLLVKVDGRTGRGVVRAPVGGAA